MKKILSMILAACMAVTAFAGCGDSNTSSKTDDSTSAATSGGTTKEDASSNPDDTTLAPHKIAVAFSSMTASELEQKEYLENYIGPAYNVEFVFSEGLKSIEDTITFIENAYSSGCEAVMNFNSDAMEQASVKAEELGMYIINNNNYISDSIKDFKYTMGSIGTSVPDVAAMFKEVVKKFVSDGENHNVIIVSGGAGQGNKQHLESTVAALEVMQETYNLTYDKEISEIATSNGQTDVNTGTDIKIVIYPGYPSTDTYIPGLSSILQTGEYDVVLSTYAVYAQFSVAVDEVEKANNMDIKVGTIASIGESLKTVFNTEDSQGSPTVDAAIVKPNCVLVGGMFTILYNALEGNADIIRQDGKPSQWHLSHWVCFGPDDYAKIENVDVSADTYLLTTDKIKSLLASNDSAMTFDKLYEALYTASQQ